MKNIPTFEQFVNESVLNEASKWKTENVEWDDVAPGDYISDGPKVGEISVVISNTKKTLVLKRVWSSTPKHKVGQEFNIDWDHEAMKDHPKSIIRVTNFVGESVETVNEDASSAILILQAALVAGQLGLLANKLGGTASMNPITNLKEWWRIHKRDKAVQSIIDKLKDDQDVIEFLQMPRSKQEGQWKKLIAPKLTTDELKYINSISRDRVKSDSI
jgi:hypothetical protein